MITHAEYFDSGTRRVVNKIENWDILALKEYINVHFE